jgi:phenylacetate-coenzyme A ligase PaaK-like adenylate-forming protein
MRIIKEDPSPRVTKVKLRIEYSQDSEDTLDDLAKEISGYFKAELRISPEIEWTPLGTLERAIRKPPLFENRY